MTEQRQEYEIKNFIDRNFSQLIHNLTVENLDFIDSRLGMLAVLSITTQLRDSSSGIYIITKSILLKEMQKLSEDLHFPVSQSSFQLLSKNNLLNYLQSKGIHIQTQSTKPLLKFDAPNFKLYIPSLYVEHTVKFPEEITKKAQQQLIVNYFTNEKMVIRENYEIWIFSTKPYYDASDFKYASSVFANKLSDEIILPLLDFKKEN